MKKQKKKDPSYIVADNRIVCAIIWRAELASDEF